MEKIISLFFYKKKNKSEKRLKTLMTKAFKSDTLSGRVIKKKGKWS